MPSASTSCGAEDGDDANAPEQPGVAPTQPEVLNEVLLRMTRAVLQHPDADVLYVDTDTSRNKQRMYKMLAEFFTHWQARRKRAVAVQLTKVDLRAVVELCAGEALTAVYTASGTHTLAAATTPAAFIARSPLLSMELTRTRLTRAGKFLLAPALAQIVELSRQLDQALTLRTPLGVINATHLAALSCALHASKTLADLALFVADLFLIDWPRRVASGPLPDPGVVWIAVHMLEAVWHDWSLLDHTHEGCWQRMCGYVRGGADGADAGPDEDLPPDYLESCYDRVARALQDDPFLRTTMTHGPDAAASLDPPTPAMRRPSTGNKNNTAAATTAAGAVAPSSATAFSEKPASPSCDDCSDDDEDDDTDAEDAIDTRFWRDLAS